MRTYAVLLLFIFFASSCANDDDFGLESTQFVFSEQKWVLTKISSSWTNYEATDADMEWQEYYIFTPDGTFLKSRTIEDSVTEATGTFEVIEFDNDTEHYLELTYTTNNSIAGSCTGDNKELLMYRSSKMLSSMWMACDGPGLDYELVKN